MKTGQTSFIVFLSKIVGSILGFLATVYFARELGAEVLGAYTLIVTIVGWLALTGELGIGGAAIKRISEGNEQGQYLSAVIVWVGVLALFISLGVILARPLLEWYIGDFDTYVTTSVAWFVIGILSVRLFYATVFRALKGERKVHIAGLLEPVKIGSQSLIQIGLVLLGYGLIGILVGYVIGGIIIGVIGLYWVTIQPRTPEKRHFLSLFDYAKFSWLGSLKSRTFNDVDILLLGVFVQSSPVGIYAVAWSLAKFLDLFGNSISSTIFPEISQTSAQETKEAAAGLVEDSLAFTGLIAIPGLVGAGILAERLMRIYGPDFAEGATVLIFLIFATLLYSYQKQLMNGLNGVNRPDLAFRINAVFITLNAGLNVVLIWQFEIEGAAIASVISVAAALVLAHRTLSRLINFQTPYGEITRQVAAAFLMGIVVFGILEAIEVTEIIQHNFVIILLLVAVGAGVYFLVLLIISSRFRATINRNLPITIPHVN